MKHAKPLLLTILLSAALCAMADEIVVGVGNANKRESGEAYAPRIACQRAQEDAEAKASGGLIRWMQSSCSCDHSHNGGRNVLCRIQGLFGS